MTVPRRVRTAARRRTEARTERGSDGIVENHAAAVHRRGEPPTDDDTLRAPAPETPPSPVALPWVQACVPVLGAVVLAAVTGSSAVLGFAALGPLFAIGVLVDGRIRSRRHRIRERERYRGEFERFERRVRARHAELTRRARSERPRARDVLTGARSPAPVLNGDLDGPPLLALGRCTHRSGMRIPSSSSSEPPALVRLRRAVDLVTGAPFTVRVRDVAIVGDEHLAVACARGLVVDLIANGEGERGLHIEGGPPAERLRGELVDAGALRHGVLRAAGASRPRKGGEHARAGVRIVLGSRADTTGDVGALLEILAPGRARVHRHGERTRHVVPEPVTARSLGSWLATLPSTHEAREAEERPPGLDVLLREPAPGGTELRAPVGTVAGRPFSIDLVRDGPHLVVAGTTGAGKSEFLRTLVVGLAERTPPSRLVLLAVDFKGGATFDPIARLPHCAGVVTDLDGDEAARLVASLTGELRRRERVLRDACAPDISALGDGLPRLVLLVDEYQALAARHEAVHEVFGDLAARGRSLGIHLVLGAQRPTGAMRPALLANLGARVCLRVTEQADALALVDDPAPARFPSSDPGLALVRLGAERRRLRIARCDDDTLESVAARTATPVEVVPPWLPPLPRTLPLASLPTGTGISYGLLDEPGRQRQRPLSLGAGRQGGTLVVGGPGCGRTALVRTIERATTRAGARAVVLTADDVEHAWDECLRIDEDGPADGAAVLMIDDADLLVERLGDRHGAVLLDRLCRIARAHEAVTIVATTQRVPTPLGRLPGLLPTTVRMSLPGRHEFVLAGGDPTAFHPDLPPGRAVIGRSLAQIAWTETRSRPTRPDRTRTLGAADLAGSTAIITSRETRWRAWADATDRDAAPVPSPGMPLRAGGCTIGGPGEWQRSLGALTTFPGRIVLDGDDAVRTATLLGVRIDDAPVADPARTTLVRDPDGTVRRARVPWGPTPVGRAARSEEVRDTTTVASASDGDDVRGEAARRLRP